MKRMLASAFAAVLLTAMAGAAFAQVSSVAPVAPSKSGMVSYIEGSVYLDEQLIPDPIIAQFPYMKENGLLRTAEGRAEVVMNPGVMVRMDANSALRMLTNRFIDTRVELVKGAAVVEIPEIAKDNSFTLVCKNATVTFAKSGFYHFYADPAGLKVFSGVARVQMGSQNIEVSAGKMLDLSGGTASAVKFDKNLTDALDRWSARRGELVAAANASSAKNCDTFVSSRNPCSGNWRWNPWYGLWTYIPFVNRWCDPFWGYCYYSQRGIMDAYYRPRVIYNDPGNFGGMGGGPSYPTAAPTSTGYSGAAAASSAASSAPSAGTGTSAASSSAASSVGVGSAAGGGHGK